MESVRIIITVRKLVGVSLVGSANMKPIPISAASAIAKKYGYDQVIIIARRVGNDPDPHGEHCTTYGIDKAHCEVAAKIGEFLKYKVMGWDAEHLVDDHDHVWTSTRYGGAVCSCGKYANGWYCPDSPTHLCSYDNGDMDSCDYCGEPEERK